MNEKGKLTQIMPVENGTSQAGKEWRKREFVIETEGQYPKKIAFTLFGDKVTIIENYNVGDMIDVHFNLESREYNGKWFHNVSCWKIEKV